MQSINVQADAADCPEVFRESSSTLVESINQGGGSVLVSLTFSSGSSCLPQSHQADLWS